jgi:hypothetical protein
MMTTTETTKGTMAVAEAKATMSLQWRRLSDGGDGGNGENDSDGGDGESDSDGCKSFR